MTNDQQTAYERALMRAHAVGLKVRGTGRWTNGAAFYVVTSASEAGRFHLVTVHAGRLSCDCTASQHGRMCQHRALAQEQIERERQAPEAQAAAVDAVRTDSIGRALAQSAATLARASASLDERERRETAMLASRSSNKPFSIWANA